MRTPTRNRPAPPVRTSVLLMLLGLALPACSGDSPVAPAEEEPEVVETEPEPEPAAAPEVVEVAVADLPDFDTERYKATCPTNGAGVGACPVIRWQGMDHVALSYRDNRLSFALHTWDAAGTLRSAVETKGARYLNAVRVDTAAETVDFVGQDDRAVTLTWSELEAMR